MSLVGVASTAGGVPLVKVEPSTVVEVSADAATQAGQVRHGMRYVRLRAALHRKTFRHFLVPQPASSWPRRSTMTPNSSASNFPRVSPPVHPPAERS
jgi:hypothetical protein